MTNCSKALIWRSEIPFALKLLVARYWHHDEKLHIFILTQVTSPLRVIESAVFVCFSSCFSLSMLLYRQEMEHNLIPENFMRLVIESNYFSILSAWFISAQLLFIHRKLCSRKTQKCRNAEKGFFFKVSFLDRQMCSMKQ